MTKNKIQETNYLEELSKKGMFFYTNSIPGMWSVYFLSTVYSLINVIMPFFLIFMVSNLWFITSIYTYVAFAIGYILIGSLWALIGFIRDQKFSNILLNYTHKTSTEAFSLITHLPYSYLSNLPIESQYNRYTPLDNFAYIWLNDIVRPLLDLPLLVLAFCTICCLLGFGYFAVVCSILLIVAFLLHFKSNINKSNKINISESEYNGSIKDMLSNINLIQAHDRSNFFGQKTLELIIKKITGNYITDTKNQIISNLIEATLLLIYISSLVIGTYYTMTGLLSMKSLIIILLLTWFTINPLKTILIVFDEINKARDILKQYSLLLQVNQPRNRQKKIFIDDNYSGTIKIQNIILRFNNGGKFQLNNMGFKLHRGELLFITGDSGSGKSVLLKIIAGLIAPSSGFVSIDHDISLIDEKSLQEKILFISHSSVFEDLTIENNLELFDISKTTDIKSLLTEQNYSKISLNDFKLNNSANYAELVNEIIISKLSSPLKNKIILLDEPFITHDQVIYDRMCKVITKLIPNNTIIVASRYKYYATLANHIILLNNGNVEKSLTRNAGINHG